jgi:hypothetical protein
MRYEKLPRLDGAAVPCVEENLWKETRPERSLAMLPSEARSMLAVHGRVDKGRRLGCIIARMMATTTAINGAEITWRGKFMCSGQTRKAATLPMVL